MAHPFSRRASAGRSHSFRPAVEGLETRLTPSVTFANQQTFAAGTNPFAVAEADINGDGRPDLVVADRDASTVSVSLNTTPAGANAATFAAPQTFAVGLNPLSVAVGDFNGDGRPDVVVANLNDNSISVLVNATLPGAATASFLAAQPFSAGSNPISVTVADVNGDGRPDVAVANLSQNSVSVFLNTTTAGAKMVTFAGQQTFAVGASPLSVAAADVNGDGRPDLVVANSGSNTVSVLLNATANGAAASFAGQQTFAVGSGPASVAAADFNGDGRPDLVVANSNDRAVSVLVNTSALGATAAAFAAQQTFGVGTSPRLVVTADLNGDGLPDVAVADSVQNAVSVLLNTTPPGGTSVSFAGQQTFATGANPDGVAAGDLNGDGRPDLAVPNFTDNTTSVLLNATATFTTATPVVAQLGTTGVWEFNPATGTWQQLTTNNAKFLAADAQGDVVAEFKGNGVWEYRLSVGWKQINGVDATALAIDPNGDVTAEFPGYGVGEYIPAAGWHTLTAANATLLAMDANGDVVAEFPGNGIWLYRPSVGFTQLNGIDATLLAIDPAGDVVANFAGYGVGEYRALDGWRIINGNQAKALTVDALGHVAAAFQGFGTAIYDPSLNFWRTVAPVDGTALTANALGDLFADFAGSGVCEYDPFRGWIQLNPTDASLLAVA